MNPRHSAANLSQATKELIQAWQRTREEWRDARADEFHDQFLADLPPHVARTVGIAEELEAVLRKAKQDCA